MKSIMSNKHAYLIMAHNQPELLCCLLRALDHEKNDIFLHLDRKMPSCDESVFEDQVKKGSLTILPQRLDVKWGQYSQIQCELNLLEAASQEKHAYYHLMSGVDFPLKSQDHIHRFFEEQKGVEFVQFQAEQLDEPTKDRVRKYHLFIKRSGTKNILERFLNKVIMLLQLPVNRTRNMETTLQKGANWFSITDELARYVLTQKEFVHQVFRHSLCGDEMCLQTLIYNSEFRDRVVGDNYCDNYRNILYCIDWKRGSPYEFTDADYDELIASDMLFARKFNWNKDNRVVLRRLDVVTGENDRGLLK